MTTAPTSGVLIVRGQARLLEDVTAMTDLERIRGLFEALETKETLLRLLDAADIGAGRADLHRRGERAVLHGRLLHGDRALRDNPTNGSSAPSA